MPHTDPMADGKAFKDMKKHGISKEALFSEAPGVAG